MRNYFAEGTQSTTQVHNSRAGWVCDGRNPLGPLWVSLWSRNNGRTDHTSCVLLALHGNRLCQVHWKMHTMPKAWPHCARPLRGASPCPLPLVIRKMGHGYSRTIGHEYSCTITPKQRLSKIPNFCCWLLLKVDRGRAPNIHSSIASVTFYLEAYNMTVWNTSHYYNR